MRARDETFVNPLNAHLHGSLPWICCENLMLFGKKKTQQLNINLNSGSDPTQPLPLSPSAFPSPAINNCAVWLLQNPVFFCLGWAIFSTIFMIGYMQWFCAWKALLTLFFEVPKTITKIAKIGWASAQLNFFSEYCHLTFRRGRLTTQQGRSLAKPSAMRTTWL